MSESSPSLNPQTAHLFPFECANKHLLNESLRNFVLRASDELIFPHIIDFARLQLHTHQESRKLRVLPCRWRRSIAWICLLVSTANTERTLVNTIHVLVPPQILAVHWQTVLLKIFVVLVNLFVTTASQPKRSLPSISASFRQRLQLRRQTGAEHNSE